MKAAAILTLCFALAGCAAATLSGLPGQPIEQAFVKFGQPTNAFRMPDGRVAVQWEVQKRGAVLVPTTTTTRASVYGPSTGNIFGTAQTTSSNVVPFSRQCRYTVYAEQQNGAWIITEHEPPRIGCL